MTNTSSQFPLIPLIRVGLVGTGYAAKLRAETLQSESRAVLAAVAGHTFDRTQEFSQTYGAQALDSWTALVQEPTLDLVIISGINRNHGAIAQAALEAGKHVVVEYPLCLDPTEAENLISLAQAENKLLHVEHIELLGGVHRALKASLSQIGTPFYVRYATINPQRPAPEKWTYDSELFGFPLMGALSRLHRLTDLFGEVASVSCQSRFWHAKHNGERSPYYAACLCKAHLRFKSGLLADVIYGKGETLWRSERMFEVHGQIGGLIFDGEQGTLVQAEGSQPIQVGSRKGLFAKDTAMVLDYLIDGTPLYVSPTASLYSLKVASAAQQSALTGQTVEIE